MTTQMHIDEFPRRLNVYAGRYARKTVRYLTLLGLAGTLLSTSALAQSLFGTFTARGQSSGVPIALNLSVSGGTISGVMGTGQPGANPPVVNPASMVTRVQGSARGAQWVVQAGAFTMTGTFTGSTFSGSYTVGSQGGVFSLSTSAPVYRAPVAAAPAPVVPVRAPAAAPTPVKAAAPKPTTPAAPPASAKGLLGVLAGLAAPVRLPVQPPAAAAAAPMAAEYLKGSEYYSGAQGTVVSQLVINLSFSGNTITGAMGIGSTIGGATAIGGLSPTIPLQGTRNGQNCTVTTTGNFGGTTYTGTCTATTFSGIYRAGGQSGNFSVTSTGQVPAQIAPAPTPIPTPAMAVAPVPARLPVTQAGATTCPASGTAPQIYRGTLYGQAQESIAFSLSFSGGRISGSMGMATLGTTAATPNPVSGTLNGQSCTLTAGGMMNGAVFVGTCNGQTFNGSYNLQGIPMQFMTSLAPGAANAVSTSCTAAPPAQLVAKPPVPPAPAPTAPMTTYCGKLTGPEFGTTIEPVRISVLPSGQGIGSMVIGNSLPGSGSIAESLSGGYCYGTTPGIEFTAICTPTTIAGFFANTAAAGPGHFEASTAACTNATATLPAPFLKMPVVVPVPPKPVQTVVTPTPPTPVPPVPVPQPKPAPVPKPVVYCGTFDDVSVAVEGVYTVTLDPGSTLSGPGTTFSGTFTMGQLFTAVTYNDRWGDGHFTGTRNGNQCSGQTDSGQNIFNSNQVDGGSCTATVFNVGYVAQPQNGSITTSTARCAQQ